MSDSPHDRIAIGARLWRSFITAAYVIGVLVWTANDAQLPTMRLTTCLYGRCPAVPVARTQMHPTVANVILLGVAAALVAWALPILFGDLDQQAKGR